MKRIFIIDEMHESIVPMLEGIGYEVDYQPTISKEDVVAKIGAFEGLILRSKLNLDKTLLDKAVKLEFIARAGAGLDKIDIKEVERRGIQLLNAPEGNRDALGEHSLGLLLALTNNIVKAHREIRKFTWDREGNRGYEIGGKTVGLLGYGNMAQAFAKRLEPFGCKILAYDKYKVNYGDEIVDESSLKEIQENADVFSIHTPLTSETRALVGKEFLSSFKKPIWMINTARGEIIPIKDLLELLESGKVLGAALDVLEKEKMHKLTENEKDMYNELFEKHNVILTPHVAGWSFESYVRINEVLTEKINLLK